MTWAYRSTSGKPQHNTTLHNEETIKNDTAQRDQEEGYNETQTLKECRMEQCLVTGGDKPTPVVTWLIRLLPRRGAVVALIPSDVHGSEGVSSHSRLGGPGDIFRFNQQMWVLENKTTHYVPICQVINNRSRFKNSYYYSVLRLQSFCPGLGKSAVKAYWLTYKRKQFLFHVSLKLCLLP